MAPRSKWETDKSKIQRGDGECDETREKGRKEIHRSGMSKTKENGRKTRQRMNGYRVDDLIRDPSARSAKRVI